MNKRRFLLILLFAGLLKIFLTLSGVPLFQLLLVTPNDVEMLGYQALSYVTPNNLANYEALATIYMERKLYNHAGNVYSRAIAINKLESVLYNRAANAYMLAHKPNRAVRVYQDAITAFGEGYAGWAYINLGNIYTYEGDYERALSAYSAVHFMHMKNDIILNNIAYLYQRQGEYDKAVRYYEQALLLNPNYGMVYAELVAVYNKLDRPDLAEYVFTTALYLADWELRYTNNNKKRAEVYKYMGVAYANYGDMDKAYKQLEKVKFIAGDSYLLYDLLKRYNFKNLL